MTVSSRTKAGGKMHIQSTQSTLGANFEKDLTEIREKARDAIARLQKLGQWPVYVDGGMSILGRIPREAGRGEGLDAGLACALDLIPRNKQRLSTILHAAYTMKAVEQVRHEIIDLTSDSETCWWLAMSSLCVEDKLVDENRFVVQLHEAVHLAEHAHARLAAAKRELGIMATAFEEIRGVPFVIRDGGLQGAYIAGGYDWGVQYRSGLFFIGTIRESLGLENFLFSDWEDCMGRPMSGPVHGSQQFVKVSSFDELARATAAVEAHLGKPKK